MPKRVLIVASKLGYQTRVFAEAAEAMGLEPVMATDRCTRLDDPWGDHAIPLKFSDLDVSIRRFQAAGRRVDGVVAVGDRPTPVAAAIAGHLGLLFHPLAAVETARNKFLARERYKAAGMLVPSYFRVPAATGLDEALSRATYPCVLKPLGLSGSRGVIRTGDAVEFRRAFERIRSILALPEIRQMRDESDEFIQVESYIDGREYALEGLASGGRLRTLAIFDKPDPLEGPFFEETIYATPSTAPPELQQAIRETVQQAVSALGLTFGPVHAEVRAGAGGVWILEVAARPIGGLCAKALSFDGGTSLETVILRHATGEPLGGLHLDGPASAVMMIPIPHSGIYRGVEGQQDALAVAGVTGLEITAKEGQELKTLPEGSSYLGFLFAKGASSSGTVQSLKEAHAKLRFDFATTLAVSRA
ncbi:MAG: ATP-grasp domain-containing protein [Bryobacterales bacterium]|nr:ATP-grasp domain-containing protein [Bryobacterales bacterium]